jgi:hypothetical protein
MIKSMPICIVLYVRRVLYNPSIDGMHARMHARQTDRRTGRRTDRRARVASGLDRIVSCVRVTRMDGCVTYVTARVYDRRTGGARAAAAAAAAAVDAAAEVRARIPARQSIGRIRFYRVSWL